MILIENVMYVYRDIDLSATLFLVREMRHEKLSILYYIWYSKLYYYDIIMM